MTPDVCIEPIQLNRPLRIKCAAHSIIPNPGDYLTSLRRPIVNAIECRTSLLCYIFVDEGVRKKYSGTSKWISTPARYGQPPKGRDTGGMGWDMGLGMGLKITENKLKLVGRRIQINWKQVELGGGVIVE